MDLQVPIDEHPDESITPEDALMRLMDNRYTMGPDMDKAYERVTFLDGSEATITAYTFIWDLPGKVTVETCQQLLKLAWPVISGAWPPGAYLRWRRRPVFEQKYDEVDQSWACRLRMRIGALTMPFVDGNDSALPTKFDS